MSSSQRTSSFLSFATLALALAAVSNPLLVKWAYQDENIPMTLAGVLPALPLLAFGGLAIWQEHDGTARFTFAARPLARSLLLMAIWVVGDALLGYFVVLLGAVVLPAAAALLAVAWVQPADDQRRLTVVLAIAVVPLVAWLAGRADERLSEAFMSGCAIALIIVALWFIRRRGHRTSSSVGA